ncbi:jg8374 [Pararge aegeria aegeria]|uniref:Jg8374 protein n=1 Tax=Pararge aegeria aegeria TaxID=348720 RepID=A0A8S4SL67_9NEOP|nr:jg8374 [Pararge aegeria aegeria]
MKYSVAAEFIISRKGKHLLKLGGYTYFAGNVNGCKIRWRCLHQKRKCNAILITIENSIVSSKGNHNHLPTPNIQPPEFIISKKGKHMIKLGGYTYYASRGNSSKMRWRCSIQKRFHCRAALFTCDDVIVSIVSKHNHPPMKHASVFITSQRGKRMIKLRGYTYYASQKNKTKTRWRCSTHRGCRAALFTMENRIISVVANHNHSSENNPTDDATDLRLCQERDDEATTTTSAGSRGARGKNAQYYRDYRARKRAEQEKESLNRNSDPSTTANSFTINVAGSVTSKKRKSAAEYQREYRARKKAKRDNILID